jgi:apolipoprotein D and lipocalin family protein
MRKAAACAVAIAALLLGVQGFAAVPSVSALPTVDLNRFAGSWYEIARLPNKREKGCIADVVDLVALADKKDRLQLVNSCKAKNDYTDVRNANIKAEKNSGGAKLRITYIWPFSDKEWILALGPDYEWLLMGSPNHKALRVLSRDRTMSPETLAEIKQRAASEGYAIDKMKTTLQTQR